MCIKLPLFKIKNLLFSFLFIGSVAFSQTKEEIQKITASYDLVKLKALGKKFSEQYTLEKSSALQFASKRSIPVFKKTKDSSIVELQRIEPDGTPIYFETHAFGNDAAISARLDYLYEEGKLGLNLMGQNMTVYIWDGGFPLVSHIEYDGPFAVDRVTIEDAVSEGGVLPNLLWHSGMVTGMIASAGINEPNAKGFAPYCRTKNYKWNNHLAEATAAAANGMLLSNHSYGWNTSGLAQYLFGSYNTETADWDTLLFNAPHYLMVTSAGNDGVPGVVYDQLTGRQLCKNNLTVANVTDAVIDSFGNLVSTSVFTTSSAGPTDELRIKPDISGNGVSVSATDTRDDHSSNYNSGGTSWAAPNITGSLLLLQQHYNNLNGNFMKAATLKGLALHTADNVGPIGPDASSGWGLLNAKSAAQTISRRGTKSIINELTLNQGQSFTINVTADGINKLMASISWTDAPGPTTTDLNSPLSRLVNDLDIRITKNATIYYPYKLTSYTTNGFGDNTVDPFERIEVDNASGDYTITVTHKGNLTTGSQNFSLIVTGISANCITSVPFEITSSEIKTNAVTLKWKNTVDNFYTLRYRIEGTSNWTTVTSSEKEIKLTGLVPLTHYEIQINSFCPGGASSNFSGSGFFTTTGTYCNSSSNFAQTEEISSITLNNLYNHKEGIYDAGYKDYTDYSAILAKGEITEINIKPALYNTSSRGYAVWIDYNRNGNFTDAGELVFSQSPTTSISITGTFVVPSTALNGGTRMRVSMKVSGIPGPCDVGFPNGEVEDYTVFIRENYCLGQTIWDGTNWSNGMPNTYLHAIMNANYSGEGFSACQLDVTGNAFVTINEGTNLIIDGGITVAPNATLKLLTDCNIIQQKNAINTGNVKIQRATSPLKRLDYVLWGSPVTNQNLLDFSPLTVTNRFYTYNSTTNLFNSINPIENNFEAGRGFLIRMPNNHPTTPTSWIGEFNGIPNNGDFTITVPTYSYVAISNPYPSAIDCFPLMIENELYYEPIYFWRKENNSLSSSYSTYVPYLGGIVNAGDPNQIVPSRYINQGQGFIVKTDWKNTIQFRNGIRLTNNNAPFLRSSNNEFENIETHKIYLNMTNDAGFSSNMMIGYLNGATTGIDPFVEGRYINDSPNALTSLINGEEFTIQGRGLPFDSLDEVPLGFKTQFAGEYTLSINGLTGLFKFEQELFVEDMLNNITHNIKESPYVFTTESGTFNNRFKIKYINTSLGVAESNDTKTTIFYSSPFLNIQSTKEIESYEIYDLMGRLLISEEGILNLSVQKEVTQIARQMLIVKVKFIDGSVINKKIIN
jgi:trimeric autotransporter adhesin